MLALYRIHCLWFNGVSIWRAAWHVQWFFDGENCGWPRRGEEYYRCLWEECPSFLLAGVNLLRCGYNWSHTSDAFFYMQFWIDGSTVEMVSSHPLSTMPCVALVRLSHYIPLFISSTGGSFYNIKPDGRLSTLMVFILEPVNGAVWHLNYIHGNVKGLNMWWTVLWRSHGMIGWMENVCVKITGQHLVLGRMVLCHL